MGPDAPHPPTPSPSRTTGPPLRGANIGCADIPSGLPASSGRGGDRASLTGEDAVWRVGLAEGGSPVQPAEEPDVYFTLVGLHDPDALGLGVWATDICLAFGRRLGDSPLSAGLRILGHEPSSDRERPG